MLVHSRCFSLSRKPRGRFAAAVAGHKSCFSTTTQETTDDSTDHGLQGSRAHEATPGTVVRGVEPNEGSRQLRKREKAPAAVIHEKSINFASAQNACTQADL